MAKRPAEMIAAGMPVHKITGTDASVYVGCFTKDWEAKGGRDPCESPA